jgi:hypothetical protein
MSDAELESACEPSFTGFSPWTYWTSEHYSLGKCLRILAHYPRFLPLYVYSDHGAGLHSAFYPHELVNNAHVYLTFHPLKAERHKNLLQKRVVRIPHPWTHYRRSRRIERNSASRGTLAFVTHHAPGFEWHDHVTLEYFASLRALPDKYQPVVLCLHMHDIHAGLHRNLRGSGFPIVTAGNTSSLAFVDRFYDLVTKFRFATSPSWGSQVAYCVELGVPYFFLGDRPRLLNLSHREVPLGEVRYRDEYEQEYNERADALFRIPVDEVTAEQYRFVNSVLGLDSRISRVQLSWILWREFFRHWRQWWPTWLQHIWRLLRKYGVRGLVRRVRENLHRAGS